MAHNQKKEMILIKFPVFFLIPVFSSWVTNDYYADPYSHAREKRKYMPSLWLVSKTVVVA
jgi:hypothetical protein